MLTVKQFTSAQDAANYLVAKEQEQKLASYYASSGDEKDCGHWHGELAAKLGFTGVVTRDDLRKALRGQDASGQDVVEGASSARRKPGYDACFSLDKSIGLAYVNATDAGKRELEEVIRTAHSEVMEQIRQRLTCNRGKGGKIKVQTRELVYATFMEFGSRANEPDIHIHTPIANLAMGEDGKLSCLDFRELVAKEQLFGAMFRASVAKRLIERGYAVESVEEKDELDHETGQVWHRLANVSQAACDQLSSRRKEIVAYAAANGVSKQAANTMTRAHKAELPYAELMELQREQMRAIGQDGWDESALKGESRLIQQQTDAAFLLDRVHTHETFFTRADLMLAVARYKGGHLDAAGIVSETDRMIAQANLVQLKRDEKGQERWAAAELVAMESEVRAVAIRRQLDASVHVAPETVEQAIAEHERAQGFSLNAEQLEAVRFVCYGSGAVACVTGRAGTGKSASIGAAVRALQAEGRQVLGTAIADKAARNLGEEAGMDCYNTASLFQKLDSGQLKLEPGTVIVLDESGMADLKTVHALLRRLNAPEVQGKLVAVGDYQQLQSVGPGAPHKMLTEVVGERTLADIKRQKNDADRDIALAMYGSATGLQLLEKMEARGQVEMAATEKDAIALVAKRYVDDALSESQKIIIAPRHAQIAALNAAVREKKKERGELSRCMSIKASAKGMGKNIDLEIGVGESLMLRKSGRDIDGKKFSNGDFGTVIALHDTRRGRSYDLQLPNGEVLRLSAERDTPISYNYAGTVHAAQGQSKDHVYSLQTTATEAHQTDRKDRNIEMVAFTRTKQRFLMVATDEGKRGFVNRLEAWKYKQNASDLALWEQGAPAEQAKAQAFADTTRAKLTAIAAPERLAAMEKAQQAAQEPAPLPTPLAGSPAASERYAQLVRAAFASVKERAQVIRHSLPKPRQIPTVAEVLQAVERTRQAAVDTLKRNWPLAQHMAQLGFRYSPEGNALRRAEEALMEAQHQAAQTQAKLDQKWFGAILAPGDDERLTPLRQEFNELEAQQRAEQQAEQRAAEEAQHWRQRRDFKVAAQLDPDRYAVDKVARDWNLDREALRRVDMAWRGATKLPSNELARGYVAGLEQAVRVAADNGVPYDLQTLQKIDVVGIKSAGLRVANQHIFDGADELKRYTLSMQDVPLGKVRDLVNLAVDEARKQPAQGAPHVRPGQRPSIQLEPQRPPMSAAEHAADIERRKAEFRRQAMASGTKSPQRDRGIEL